MPKLTDVAVLHNIVKGIAEHMIRQPKSGKATDCFPVLAKADLNKFWMVAALTDVQVVEAGDTEAPFPNQSISKGNLLLASLVLEDLVRQARWTAFAIDSWSDGAHV